ncbi:LysR family transcriptional regulator [soil metagenome]
MQWLNYHHLYYFWMIAQEGGVAPAARKLHLTHSTLSAQLRALEEQFGAPLFERRGKRLVLTSFGTDAVGYAADIFRLGQELTDVAHNRAEPGGETLRVGVVAAMPKTLVHNLLQPALEAFAHGVVNVRQDASPRLVESLIAGRLHLVLADEVPVPTASAKVHAHPLGETEIFLYGSAEHARKYKRGFPGSLQRAPMLLPPPSSSLRRRLDAWFAENDVVPAVKAEVDDAGILRAFGDAGLGVFAVRGALRAEVENVHRVSLIGRCEGVRERYYALSSERRIRHPAVVALVEHARKGLHSMTSPGR